MPEKSKPLTEMSEKELDAFFAAEDEEFAKDRTPKDELTITPAPGFADRGVRPRFYPGEEQE